jgi:hypothetical protein
MSAEHSKHKKGTSAKRSSRASALSGSGTARLLFNLVAWVVFCASIALWGTLFGSRLSEFGESASIAERQLHLSQSLSSAEDSVLGITDVQNSSAGNSSDEEGTVNLSDVIAQEMNGTNQASDEDVASVVDQIEEDRKAALREVLVLQLPQETDNPNYPVTFEAPTESGVEIQVDGEGFAPAMSPFSLPALSVGEHILNFRFVDDDGVTQNLEETVVVIPRSPVWAEDQRVEFTADEQVSISGTALPNSRVVLLISSTLVSQVTDADSEGAWSATIEAELESGEHTAVAFVRKSGFASNFSDPLLFTIGMVEGASSVDNGQDTQNEKKPDLLLGIIPYTEDNYYLVMAGAGVVIILLLILFTTIVKAIVRSGGGQDLGVLKQATCSLSGGSSGETLREKFQKAGIGVSNGTGKKVVKAKLEEKKEEAGKEAVEKDVSQEDESKKEQILEKSEETKTVKDEELTSPKETEDKKEEEFVEGPISSDAAVGEGSETPKPVEPQPGKVYSKDEFLKKFGASETTAHKETNKIRISLTSNKGK